jgi:carbon monoxide dehydrogenase subunit G
MAIRHQLIRRPPADVWAVLRDADQYCRWVIGTHDSWEQEGSWPEEGASLGFTLKLGPVTYRSRTISRIHRPGERLELESIAGRAGTARIAIQVLPWGGDTLVTVDEHPLRGPTARWHNTALDALIQLRHRGMLARLAEVVESRAGAPAGEDVSRARS